MRAHPAEATQTTELQVRELQPHELADAVALIARGTRDNPMHVAAYGRDPQRRVRCHQRIVRGVFRTFPEQQPLCVVRGATLVAVTGVAPAGSCRPTVTQRLRLLPSVLANGPRTAAHVGEWIAAWSRHDLDEPHVHLGPLAVDAHLQGRGIGSLLMNELCRRLDGSGQVGYLETDRPANVRLLERFGFRVIGEEAVIGVPNWFMRRSPATPR